MEELLERAAQLLVTLESDVAGLEADQQDERRRIQADWQRQQEAVDLATDRLERMNAHARELAARKAKLTELDAARHPMITRGGPTW